LSGRHLIYIYIIFYRGQNFENRVKIFRTRSKFMTS
jgi:hypothetical protein